MCSPADPYFISTILSHCSWSVDHHVLLFAHFVIQYAVVSEIPKLPDIPPFNALIVRMKKLLQLQQNKILGLVHVFINKNLK